MSDVLARRYRVLMRAYPAAYRRERGDEIVATLLERSGDRRRPPMREVLGLLSGALQAHLSPGGSARHAWTGGLRAAALVLLAVELSRHLLRLLEAAPAGRIGLVQILCGLVAFRAVRRDRRVVAVVATLAWQAAVVWGGVWSPAVGTATVLLLVLLAVGWRIPLPALHPGWWFTVPVVALALGGPGLAASGPLYDFDYRQAVVITAIVLLAAVARIDVRAAFVAAGLLLWQGVVEMVHLIMAGDSATGHVAAHVSGTWWGFITAGAAVALLVGGHVLAWRRAKLV